MKSQGLPLNFIVLAALAILILVLAAGFVIGGGATLSATMSPENARTTCNNFCMNAQRSASDTYDETSITTWKGAAIQDQRFCTATFDVQGVGKGVKCPQVMGTCRITFGDGTTYALDASGCTSDLGGGDFGGGDNGDGA